MCALRSCGDHSRCPSSPLASGHLLSCSVPQCPNLERGVQGVGDGIIVCPPQRRRCLGEPVPGRIGASPAPAGFCSLPPHSLPPQCFPPYLSLCGQLGVYPPCLAPFLPLMSVSLILVRSPPLPLFSLPAVFLLQEALLCPRRITCSCSELHPCWAPLLWYLPRVLQRFGWEFSQCDLTLNLTRLRPDL